MTELEKGPLGRRRGRGARERILSASQQLFRDQGINGTGMDQLCAAAQVSKRTAYQHFAGKDELVTEYLRRSTPTSCAARFAETAREAGAANPEQLGEQLALLLDGASARTRVLNTDTFPTAAAIAAVLIDNAIPAAARGSGGGVAERARVSRCGR